MKVYGYTRVSTERQADEGESLDVQRRQIGGYAMMKGLEIGHVFVERGVSGSTPLSERPQGAALLAILEPGDVVVTAKLDRMFRSALDALEVLSQLKERGVSLHMVDLGGDVTGNGISKLVFTILSAVAETERDRIRERVRDVKRDQKERHRFLGGTVPFGMDLAEDGSLVPDPIAQAAIATMRDARAAGRSLRQCAEMVRERHGLEVSHMTVKRVLESLKAERTAA
jgi:putative DNA-invertase from lambdoid prophage Rac